LFTPFTVRGITARNRIVRSATAERLADPDGRPLEGLGRIIRALSEGGVGWIITGHAYVDGGGKCHPEMTGIHDDALIEPLGALVRAGHEGGAKIAVQINHGGRACDPEEVAEPVAPSPVAGAGREDPPRALTASKIADLVDAFGAAAGRAKAAGFDAVQIHGAHGYLVSQFLSPLSNRRTDGYGGDLRKRARFLFEVAEAVRGAVGDTMPLWVKLGVTDNEEGGLTVEEGAEVASWLGEVGVDAIETSTAGKGAMATRITRPEREAYLLPLALAVRERCALPLFLVGGLRSRAVMERVLKEGMDGVSLSRPLIREPDLPRLLETGVSEKGACISCSRCWPQEPGEGIACRSRR
jgi:2,4-dienoyl-CoA reductase-like NADH-dependent reductase (Old Yellow Enzyme family)